MKFNFHAKNSISLSHLYQKTSLSKVVRTCPHYLQLKGFSGTSEQHVFIFNRVVSGQTPPSGLDQSGPNFQGVIIIENVFQYMFFYLVVSQGDAPGHTIVCFCISVRPSVQKVRVRGQPLLHCLAWAIEVGQIQLYIDGPNQITRGGLNQTR